MAELGGIVLAIQMMEAAQAGFLAFESYYSTFRRNVRDYGYIRGLALETIFFQARGVVQRIRANVVVPSGESAKEAWSVKESYATSFNMIAVAVSYATPQNHFCQLIIEQRVLSLRRSLSQHCRLTTSRRPTGLQPPLLLSAWSQDYLLYIMLASYNSS